MTPAGPFGSIPPMVKGFRQFFTRPRDASARRSPACVEAVEKRTMLSVTVVKEELFGPDPREVDGVVITFSEALDPATAQNLKNYRVGRRTDHHDHDVNTVDHQH